MQINISVNNKIYSGDVTAHLTLLEFLRQNGFSSVRRGCDTTNCGLCTVWVDGSPTLSCSYPAVRAQGKQITTVEGVPQDAAKLASYLASQGAEQCGYCSPGFIMTVLAMKKELQNPTEEQINQYLAGNLCRCTGYMSHMRILKAYLDFEEASL